MPIYPEGTAKAMTIRTSKCSSGFTPRWPIVPRQWNIRLSKTACAGWCCWRRRWRAPRSRPGSAFEGVTLRVGARMASNVVTKLSEEQYLAIDRAAEVRSEFVDGEMVAMSGGSMRHARLQQNISAGLDAPSRDRGCEVFGSDFRVRVSRRMYAYPDISLVCGEPRLADEHQDIL